MATEKELKIKITANSQQFLSSIKGVNTSLDGLIANFSKFNLSTVGAVAALGTLVAGFSKIVKSTANYGDELNKTSQKIGISVEALSGLNYAAKLSDVTNEQLSTGLKKLSVNVVDAGRGVCDAKDAFNALGISAKDSKGDMQTSDVILLQVAERFKNMEDGIGKTALAVKIFGKAGADLIPLLNQGASGIKAATDEAKAFGLVIDKESSVAAEEFNDNITRMTELMSGVVYSIGNAVIPAINDLTKAGTNYSKEGRKT